MDYDCDKCSMVVVGIDEGCSPFVTLIWWSDNSRDST